MSLNPYVVSQDEMMTYDNDIIIDTDTITDNDVKINPNKEYSCSICLNSSSEKEFIKIKCGHIFHKECIKQWLITQGKVRRYDPTDNLHLDGSCPLCRKRFSHIFFSDDYMDSFDSRVPYIYIFGRFIWRMFK